MDGFVICFRRQPGDPPNPDGSSPRTRTNGGKPPVHGQFQGQRQPRRPGNPCLQRPKQGGTGLGWFVLWDLGLFVFSNQPPTSRSHAGPGPGMVRTERSGIGLRSVHRDREHCFVSSQASIACCRHRICPSRCGRCPPKCRTKRHS